MMNTSSGIDLNSPALHDAEQRGKFHARSYLLAQILPELMNGTADFIQTAEDECSQRFRRASEFMEYDLEDVFSASVDSLQRCGFFPYAELSYEFDAFQTLLLQGRYKHTRDSLRRMLELSVNAVMYLLGLKDVKEAHNWISSEGEAPQYSRAVQLLKRVPLIGELDSELQFSDALKRCYWDLCDYCHTRGIEYSTGIRKGSQMNFNGIVFPAFKEEECRKVMSQFVDAVGLMAVLFVVHNPGLLVPVDKDAKWGLNGPVSGFFYEKQVEDLYAVLPVGYTDFFRHFAKSDEKVCNLQEYIASLPDLTEAELQQQADEFKKEIGQ